MAHDALGRVTQAIDKDFVYDPLGRLVLVKAAGVVVESYHYDGDGRLVRVNRHDENGYTPSAFLYEGEHMVSGWTDSDGWSRDWQAVWGPSQDELLEFHDFNAGRTLIVVPDHRNSATALIDEATGHIFALARYTPEGLVRVLEPDGSVLCDERASLDTTCTLPIPFGFNGMWRSEQSGLSYMRNRWYSAQLAQFMSHDPLEYIDSYNLYAFATLDPINFWDPWGLDAKGLAATGSIADSAWAGLSAGVSNSNNSGSVSSWTPGDSFSPLGQFIRPPQNSRSSVVHPQSTQSSAQQMPAASGGSRYGVMGVPLGVLTMNQRVARIVWLLHYWRVKATIVSVNVSSVGMASKVAWKKDWPKGKLAEHFGSHGKEFGRITQIQYRDMALAFARETGRFQEKQIKNLIIKYDPKTRRVLVGHVKDRSIRTFYKAKDHVVDPVKEAVDRAIFKTRVK